MIQKPSTFQQSAYRTVNIPNLPMLTVAYFLYTDLTLSPYRCWWSRTVSTPTWRSHLTYRCWEPRTAWMSRIALRPTWGTVLTSGNPANHSCRKSETRRQVSRNSDECYVIHCQTQDQKPASTVLIFQNSQEFVDVILYLRVYPHVQNYKSRKFTTK